MNAEEWLLCPICKSLGLHTIIADKTGDAFILEEGNDTNIVSPSHRILLAYISENHLNKEDQLVRQTFLGYSRKRRK